MISFEFFPPKTPEGQAKLIKTAKQLAQINPTFFSVTYGAGGSQSVDNKTLDTVMLLRQITGVPTAPHLSCITASKENIISILRKYQKLNIKHIVAIRGDLPTGMNPVNRLGKGELNYGYQLVELIRETTANQFHIEVACYPECHPQAINFSADLENLKRKIDAGANSAITQYFYNLDAYFYFRDRATRAGIHVPIIPGIMPIINFDKIIYFSRNCGADIPRWLFKQIEEYRQDVQAIQSLVLEFITHLCQKLMAAGAPGLHFYTLNQAELSLAICDNLQLAALNSKKSKEGGVLVFSSY